MAAIGMNDTRGVNLTVTIQTLGSTDPEIMVIELSEREKAENRAAYSHACVAQRAQSVTSVRGECLRRSRRGAPGWAVRFLWLLRGGARAWLVLLRLARAA